MNFIDLIFINFIVVIVIIGALINNIEPFLPAFITQTFRYGKHAYEGQPSRLAQLCELPKSYFKHFYMFALIWSLGMLYLVTLSYVSGSYPAEWLVIFLDLLCGRQREVKTSSITTFIALTLLALQCVRRFYETHFIQVYATTSRMNLSHYLVGYFHYFGAVLTIMSQAQGFVRGSAPLPLSFDDLLAHHYVAVALFLYSWWHQYKSNLILANLRKNSSGRVITQKHLMPVGGYFESVSSPHMFFEVMMYVALYILLHNNSSWLFVLCWVITNQIENAWLTHKWYMATFAKYPLERRAIFPKFL